MFRLPKLRMEVALRASLVAAYAAGLLAITPAQGASSSWQGVLAADTIWGPQQGPYTITDELEVASGVTLTILPGTTVLLAEGARVVIRGRLLAEGTPDEPIRFTRQVDKGRWRGLQFERTMEENLIRHALLEYARTDDGMVGLDHSRLLLEHVEFDHCDRRRIATLDSSLIVRQCRFADLFAPDQPPTTDNLSEHIWGSGIPDDGWFLIEDNVFGRKKGHNDAIDFDGPARPKPIPHIRNNLFLGGGDDAMDLECDAMIEGNVFLDFVKDGYNKASGEANVLSAGAGKHYVLTHNIFANAQHIAQVKDGAFLTFVNNTAVNISGAAIYLDLDLPGRRPGRGVIVESSIFWNAPLVFEGMTDETQLTVSSSLLPEAWHCFGDANIDGDPLFARTDYWDPNGTPDDPNDDFWVQGDYHLQSEAGRWDPITLQWVIDTVTSPCIDAGDPNSPVGDEPPPNGGRINMGAYGGTAEASLSPLDAGY